MAKPLSKTEQLAEELYKTRMARTLEYARDRYRWYWYLTTNEAFQNGFATEDDQKHAREVLRLLETLFGKEQFTGLI